MDEQPIRYPIKTLSGAAGVIRVSFLLIFYVMLFARLYVFDISTPQYIGVIVCWSLGCIGLSLLLKRLKKPGELIIHANSLSVDGQVLLPLELQAVLVRGYFWPVVGLQPNGRKLVPLSLGFQILEDEDQGIRDLAQWAERNEVKYARKSFYTLI